MSTETKRRTVRQPAFGTPVRRRKQRRRLDSRATRVDGRRIAYASGGSGLPVLFLHGWGLDHRAYDRSLGALVDRGCRVLAPSLPGFGGSSGLRIGSRSMADYADWLRSFLDELEVDEPLIIIGHSFGGGVATKFAHDNPGRTRYLVLMNSVGATRPFGGGLIDHIGALGAIGPLARAWTPTPDGASERKVHRVMAENILRDPLSVSRAGQLAMTADLSEEMANLAEREVPVLVLWSDRDSVIPKSAFDTFCATFGESEMVDGGHSWLLADPDAFGQVLDNVLHAQRSEHRAENAATQIAQLREHLVPTSVPRRAINQLLRDVTPMWALSAPPNVLAADISLCHPRLADEEVRAVARPVGTAAHRLTVVAHDRPGLLAQTTSLLANENIRVESASAMTWPEQGLALHSLVVQTGQKLTSKRWDQIGERLQNLAQGDREPMLFRPAGKARVVRTAGAPGTSTLRVTAPDQLGLLSAICSWLTDHDVSVEAAHVATVDGYAEDVFLVRGEAEFDDLAKALSAPARCALVDIPLRAGEEVMQAAMQLAGLSR